MTYFCVHRFAPEHVDDHKGYGDVDKCIYCGETPSYLTKEHIIGKALNGRITLGRSSCKKCQNITRAIEDFCFGHMRYFRLKTGFKSSRKPPFRVSARYKEEPPGIIEMTRNELPGALAIPTAPPPKLFFGEWPTPNSGGCFQLFSDMKWPKDTVFTNGPFKITTYCRFIAKIAHGYACAEVGLGNFEPFLPNIILKEDGDPCRFVGCTPKGHSLSKEEGVLNRLSLECWEQDGRLYLVANVRLLAYIGAPEYYAVVGTVPDIPMAAMTRAFSSKTDSTQVRQ